MPVSLSEVMLGEYIVPNWVSNGRPPANGLPPSVVWQAWQSAASVRYFPRANLSVSVKSAGTPVGCPALYCESATVLPPAKASGPGRIAAHASTARPITATTPTPIPTRRPAVLIVLNSLYLARYNARPQHC